MAAGFWLGFFGQTSNLRTANAVAAEGAAGNISPSVVDEVLSLFDPDEVTKSGRKLPKAYVRSSREVIKTLRESLGQDVQEGSDFRKGTEKAKDAIRAFLVDWKTSQAVASEDSFVAINRALRQLGDFYAKKGPRAVMPSDIKTNILRELDAADAAL
eukprot:TRINITY_DN837_c0_g1_i1.p1 TRINITY_DN837_c0_g1~~TRINITY_DN837_c0_g1_i1.p1  ORF type:complete len:172 (+),score=27.97 TRINITY_DN837_c0_g1_i1:47-517(+)